MTWRKPFDAAVQGQAGRASKAQDPRLQSPATLLIGVPGPYTSNPQDFDHWGPRTLHLKVLGLHTPNPQDFARLSAWTLQAASKNPFPHHICKAKER